MRGPDVDHHAGRQVEVQIAEEAGKGGSDMMRGCQMGLQLLFLFKFRTAKFTDERWQMNVLLNGLLVNTEVLNRNVQLHIGEIDKI